MYEFDAFEIQQLTVKKRNENILKIIDKRIQILYIFAAEKIRPLIAIQKKSIIFTVSNY